MSILLLIFGVNKLSKGLESFSLGAPPSVFPQNMKHVKEVFTMKYSLFLQLTQSVMHSHLLISDYY